jgi:hypothetical protein
MSSPSLHSLPMPPGFEPAPPSTARPSEQAFARGDDRPDMIATTRPRVSRSHSIRHFVVHYVEMVVVMFVGMFVLMPPTGWVFGAFGTSWSRLTPAAYVFAMALTMTVPMVGWMRYRGHTWRANVEMAASMLIPAFAVMAGLAVGAAKGTLTVPEHAAMLSAMLVAMLLRRDEYSAAHHNHAQAAIAV